MELISQRTKKIMEECRKKAEAAGMNIQGETLEYIVTNQDMIELSPKIMIPTLYDYWVHDVEVIRDKWIYDVRPHNAYETAINTRPAISFYNDNNPDWLNTMIFYHVLGHIDFFQNNVFFRNTWNDDFCGEALADKRLLNRIREEMGGEKRWVDYVIEFARSADNLVGYYAELEEADKTGARDLFGTFSEKADFYFGEFLRERSEANLVEQKFYYDELARYNDCQKHFGQKRGDAIFFDDVDFRSKFPEFAGVFTKRQEKKAKKVKSKDILHYLMEHSEFINKDENKWMKDVLGVVRRTSLYFQPQFRDQIANEGWASFWHEKLFMEDERMSTHEFDFAKVNSGVVANPKIGFNPYAIGKSIFEFIEELAMKGKLSYEYQMIKDANARKRFDQKLGCEYGKKALFGARRNLDDSMLINFLSDADFQDFVDKYKLFVAGERLNWDKGVIEIYIKSKDGKDYRKALNDSLYHPPYVLIGGEKARDGELYLDHVFEGRTLVTKYIPQVMANLAYLAGNRVRLETTEFEMERVDDWAQLQDPEYKPEYKKQRALYTYEGGTLRRTVLADYRGEE